MIAYRSRSLRARMPRPMSAPGRPLRLRSPPPPCRSHLPNPRHEQSSGPVPPAVSGPSQMAKADIGVDPVETKPVDTGHRDAAQLVPTTCDASADATRAAPATQDFRYLICYVWSELPPAEKPAAIVLRSLKDIPVGTPVEEIKRASDAFGLDFTFMKAVAKIEFRFRPQAAHRVVYRPVPAEQIRVREIRLRGHSQSPR